MIKTTKKFVAILLVVVMAISSFPIASFAATEYTEGDYTYTVSDSEATIVSYPETAEGVVDIPNTLGGYPVTAIGAYAFWGCTLITEISIPVSITKIGNGAFGYCTYLATVNYGGTEEQWNEIAIGSGNEALTNTDIKYNPGLQIVVKDNNGRVASDALVVFYDSSSNIILSEKTDSKGVCSIEKSLVSKAKTVSAYKDIKDFEGGSNREAAREKFENVVYTLRITSDTLTSSGKWKRELFDSSKNNITLEMNNPKIIYNCSVSYFMSSETGDYYSDVVTAFECVNEYIQRATDGYCELGKVAIYSTTDAKSFNKKDSTAAKCDVQIRQVSSSSTWGSDVWPNAHVNGVNNDSWYGEYLRVQMQKNAIGSDISTDEETWARIVTHELGHYFFGFYDEYLNVDNQQWSEIGRPKDSPNNYGLMEYQYTDLEMSVPLDYKNASSLSKEYKTKQFFKHGVSCWEFFNNTFFIPNGVSASIPTNDRTYEEVTNKVEFFDCRSKSTSSSSADMVNFMSSATENYSEDDLFAMATIQDDKIILRTDEVVTKCQIADLGFENIQEAAFEKITGGYQLPIDVFPSTPSILIVESELGVNTFDFYNVKVTPGESFHNANNSVMIQSSSNQDANVLVYNNTEDSELNHFGYIVAIDFKSGSNFKLVGRTTISGNLDYSSLSWYKLEDDEWMKQESKTSLGEYSSLETSCTVTQRGVYALRASNALNNTPELPADSSYFTTQSDPSMDGGIKVDIDYDENVIGYRIVYKSKDRTEENTIVTSNKEVSIKADKINTEYVVDVVAILNSGMELSLGKSQVVVSGEYYQDGSLMPYWWVVKYDLQNEEEIVDNKDNDGDGATNLQEYQNGTNPIDASDKPEYKNEISIKSPSRTEIRNKDGIVLHANVDGASAESYVVWTSSNGNFSMEDLGNGKLEIIAKNKGWTTFTATLYDADGNVLATDSVEVYSKSGFFDKIGGFFRGLFGTTTIYDE